MLAVGFVLLREMSDRIVRSESELAEALGIPVFGVLDREKRGRRRVRPTARTPQGA
jgi:capsular polysaccharide biosynthesis protein